jgi:hypothetical protein
MARAFTSPGRPARSGVLIAGALVLSGAAGCFSLGEQARKAFAEEFACPLARVTLAEQHGRPYVASPPPEEIVRDPDRLAVWRQQVAQLSTTMADRTYYVTRGCGHEQTLYCRGLPTGIETNSEFECTDQRNPSELDPDLTAAASP